MTGHGMSQKQTLYQQIYDRIVRDARQGQFPHGTAMPTVKQLMQRYGTKQSTLCRALSELKKDNIITTHQGGGIYLNAEQLPPTDNAVPAVADTQASVYETGGLFTGSRSRKKVRLSFIDSSSNHQAMWQALLARFKDHYPAIDVEAVFGGKPDDDSRLSSDIIQLQAPTMLKEEVQQQLFPIMKEFIADEVYPAAVFKQLQTDDDRVYAVPFYAGVPVFLVNTDLVAKAGCGDLPAQLNWDQFKTIALQLGEARQADKLDDAYAMAYIHSSFLYLCASQPYINTAAQGDGFDWEQPEVEAFFQEITELGSKNEIVMPNSVYEQEGGVLRLFEGGKLAMAAVLSRNVNDLYPNGLPANVRVMPFPVSDGGCTFWHSGYLAISRQSLQLGECLKLIQFLCSKEAMTIIARFNEVPIITNGIDSIQPQFKTAFDRALPINYFTNKQMNFIIDHFNPIVDYARDGMLPADTAYRMLVERSRDFFAAT